MQCSVRDCNRPGIAKDLCSLHYSRLRRTGTTEVPPTKRSTEERFWARVDRSGGPEACWVWTGHRQVNGYGKFAIDQERRGSVAHRYAYELLVGPIPEGLQIDHLCFNRACVNPKHLEAVTPAENTARSTNAGAEYKRTGKCRRGHDLAENGYDGRDRGYLIRRCGECRRQRERVGKNTDRADDRVTSAFQAAGHVPEAR